MKTDCLRLLALTTVGLGSFAGTRLAAQPVRAGSEFQVNTYTTWDQGIGKVGLAPDGRFAVVWVSRGQTGDIFWYVYGQCYDAHGVPRGAEFRVSDGSTRASGARVGMDAAGTFTVVWDADDSQGAGVFARRYHDDGGAEPPFLVSTSTTAEDFRPDIAVHADGRAVVVWNKFLFGQNQQDLVGRRLAADGTPVGAEFAVNSYTTGAQTIPRVAMDASGAFVVVWLSFGNDGDGFGVFGRRFDSQANPLGSEFQVNVYTTSYQTAASVAADGSGRFLVVWASPQDGSGTGIVGRRYDEAGVPGPEFQVNADTTGNQGSAYVASDGPDRFVVAWSAGGDRVMAKRYEGIQAREPESVVNPAAPGSATDVATDGSGDFIVAFTGSSDGSGTGVFGQRLLEADLLPAALEVDAGANRVLEPGEEVAMAPAWRNRTDGAIAVQGGLVALGGAGSPELYEITDGVAEYGLVPAGAQGECSATADCYRIALGAPPTRPSTHWDAFADELLSTGETARWSVHVGASFTDVPPSNGFYRFVETLLHRSITAGCTATAFCPSSATTREQMAVFVLVAKEGAGFVPAACATPPLFDDVPPSSPFCRWIEELVRRGVTGGCGGGIYCPGAPVTREQMAVFVLRTLEPALDPPACQTPMFADLPATSPFCRWVEELARRGVVSGCGGGNYCPADPVTREQMGVFLGVTFGLTLYGP